MNVNQKIRTHALMTVAVVLWTLLAWWLIFLFQFERDYQQTFFARLRRQVDAPFYSPPAVIDYRDDKSVVWIGWSEPDQGFRWSIAKRAGMLFRLSGERASSVSTLRFQTVCSLKAMPVTVKINDRVVGTVVVNGMGLYALSIQPGIVATGVNSIELLMPEARRPGTDDLRILAIGLAEFALVTHPGG